MGQQLYWLNDAEWQRLELAYRVDDRRVISGIVHMLRSGARWRDCPPDYGPYTRVYNRFNRWSRQGIWLMMFKAVTGTTGVLSAAASDSSHVKAHRSAAGGKGGAFDEAIGRSRGGRTTTIHALSDALGRPRVLLIAPGNVHDVMMAPQLLKAAGPIKRLLADKAYDTNNLRRLLAEHGIEAVIPSIARRKATDPVRPQSLSPA